MIKWMERLVLSTALMFVLLNAFAQDPQLSQFYASPIYTNPAFAGAAKKIRFTTNARNQYTGLNKTYRTSVTSVDAYIPKMQSGLGAIVSIDQAGDGYLTTIGFGGIYSYNLTINRKWNANFALKAEIQQKSYDFNKFIFGDQLDPVLGYTGKPSAEISPGELRIFPNFAAGALIYSEFFYAGFAVNNLTEPNQSFVLTNSIDQPYILPRRYTAHMGANISLKQSRFENNRVYLSPNVLFMSQRDFYQVNVGTYIKKQALTAGMWFRQTSRNSDAMIFLLGLRFQNFRIGYSYDLTVSNAKTATVGSHEISLGFDINTKGKTRSRMGKPIKCPEL
ncbi:MAG: type IX secretion system membrane protein PorP/SprF [Bacteroidia bacterium]|nr:type IX secretion system membrane protein PorP/SprF [Bacteroidia bacterium]